MLISTLAEWYLREPDIKVHLLGRDLAQRGHSVIAVTEFRNYPGGQLHPGYRLRWRQWESRNGVWGLRMPLYPDHSRSGLKRIINYFSFA
jgi:hypothetical protein